MFLVVTSLAILSCASAQPQTPDERVRTSTVVPDLHNLTSGWKVISEKERLLYQNETMTVKVSEEYYENPKDNMRAFLYVKSANGKREELSMIYGTNDVARGAIRSGGAWHVSRELYFDNGKINDKGSVASELIMDETNKPVKIKLTLETVDGPKEVIIDLQ